MQVLLLEPYGLTSPAVPLVTTGLVGLFFDGQDLVTRIGNGTPQVLATQQWVTDQGGGGGGGVWGAITGDINDQSDLQGALGLKADLDAEVSFLSTTAANFFAPLGKDGASATTLKTSDTLYGLEISTADGSEGVVTVLGENNLKSGSGPGHLVWQADGSGNIGQSGDKRPANIYAALTLNAPSLATTALLSDAGTGVVTIGEDGMTAEHVLNVALEAADAGVLTLTNAPVGVSGNPTAFIRLTLNGGGSFIIPAWALP